MNITACYVARRFLISMAEVLSRQFPLLKRVMGIYFLTEYLQHSKEITSIFTKNVSDNEGSSVIHLAPEIIIRREEAVAASLRLLPI